MLETVNLDQSLPKDEYKRVMEPLRLQLGEMQRRLRNLGVRTVILLEGWDAAGKGTVIGSLTAALDPRGFAVSVTEKPTEEERMYPYLTRFWRQLPSAGAIAIFDRSWYRRLLDERVEGEVPPEVWQAAYDEITQFERQLAADGYLLLKFWLHISRKEQRKRFKQLLADPAFAWRVGPDERRRRRKWDQYLEAVEEMLARTSTGRSPWTVIESNCSRYARTRVFETVVDAMGRAADEAERRKAEAEASKAERRKAEAAEARRAKRRTAEEPEETTPAVKPSNPLDRVDLTLDLSRADYAERLDSLQEELRRLEHECYIHRMPVVLLYEGWDASGKGGNIRRLTADLDPRGYDVIPVGAPTAQELANHYLRRFWIRLPKAGHFAIFDRSWYGRLMVERIEGYCSEEEWRRAYQEINEFEAAVARYGTVIVKFWLHISQEEQLRRFEDRQNTPYKQWKITDEDWRNREKWDQYYQAVGEMIQRTSTTYAPWTIVEGDSKTWARVRALQAAVDAVKAGLKAKA